MFSKDFQNDDLAEYTIKRGCASEHGVLISTELC